MTRSRSRILALVAAPLAGVLLALGLAPSPATADVAPPDFESFSAEYFLGRDDDGRAELRVIETIVAVYPDYEYNKGFYRDLPKFYQEMPLNPTVLSVTDENGDDVPYTVEDYEAGDGLDYKYSSIALGDDSYVMGRKTYVIEYRYENVVHSPDNADIDEFYWDVNGADTGIAIGRVSVELHLEDGLVDALTGEMACYPGYYTSDGDCELASSDGGATLSASVEEMYRYDTMTIAVAFEPGTFTPGERITDHWIFSLAPKLLLGLSLLLLGVALFIRLVLWRDARGRGIIVPQYSVPDDHDILLSADVIGRGHEALAAAFVDLAVRGFVDVVDLEPNGPDDDDRFALVFRTRDGATQQEKVILNALFDDFTPGEEARLGSLSASAGATLYAMGLRARDRSVNAGLRQQPSDVLPSLLRRSVWVLVLGFAAVLIWTFVVEVDAARVFGWLFGSVGAHVIMRLLLQRPYLLTAAGADKRDYLIGMRQYLQLAEEERLRVLQSPEGADRVDTADRGVVVKLHEKLLPYAILWDVEQDWAKQLQVEYEAVSAAPGWIATDLHQTDLARAMSSFSRGSVSSVRPIVPVRPASSGSSGGWGGSSWSGGSSSFSSGSSGGGFSGGGGGGGGMRGR